MATLIKQLEDSQWTGRKGYGPHVLLGACLVKSLYDIPTWTRATRLLREHTALADAIGGAPSAWACYRFAAKLRRNGVALDDCVERILRALHELHPELGQDVAIDASHLVAYANGQRKLSKHGPERTRFSDPDASWGHRSANSTQGHGGFYGYKLHQVVCTRTGLPLAWEVATGRDNESTKAMGLLDRALSRGFRPRTVAADKGYDHESIHAGCMERGAFPVIALRRTTETLAKPYEAPECVHGLWTFAGAELDRRTTKWRCPTGECRPKTQRIKASRFNPLIPRQSKRHRTLYRGRAAVEREFARLKNEYGLAPLRVRRLERVQLHADLTMLARLALALARSRAEMGQV